VTFVRTSIKENKENSRLRAPPGHGGARKFPILSHGVTDPPRGRPRQRAAAFITSCDLEKNYFIGHILEPERELISSQPLDKKIIILINLNHQRTIHIRVSG
jgi:hypothetical protein